MGEAAGIARVEDVMFRHVVSGTPDSTIREAANLLRGRTVGALPILEGERLVGIVTISDSLDLLGRGTGARRRGDPEKTGHRGIAGRSFTAALRARARSEHLFQTHPGHGWAAQPTEREESDDEERNWPIDSRGADRARRRVGRVHSDGAAQTGHADQTRARAAAAATS